MYSLIRLVSVCHLIQLFVSSILCSLFSLSLPSLDSELFIAPFLLFRLQMIYFQKILLTHTPKQQLANSTPWATSSPSPIFIELMNNRILLCDVWKLNNIWILLSRGNLCGKTATSTRLCAFCGCSLLRRWSWVAWQRPQAVLSQFPEYPLSGLL